ncbi:MAG TPA: V-type ATP synthase subunit I [Candidatus Aminicenantes bacterium]|nr:V-type ATP synthase subunit I [Candidatus Aminicenantes bacterium]
MIVPMRKATVVIRRAERAEALRRLRRLGVLHLAAVPAQVPSAQEWREKRDLLEKALATVAPPGRRPLPPEAAGGDVAAALETARVILERREAARILEEEAAELAREQERLREWQGVSLADLRPLQARGFAVRFYEVPARKLRALAAAAAFVVRRRRGQCWVAIVARPGSFPEVEFKALTPPHRDAVELEALRGENRADRDKFRAELRGLAAEAGRLSSAARAADREIELAEAAAALGHAAELSFLTGFLPGEQVAALREACRHNGWALLLQDPAAGDEVPTIVRNRRWIDVIQPVFQLLGTVPGYREFDISLVFLLFFVFFFAAIVGDGGYGLVFLAASLFFSRRARRRGQEPPAILPLLALLSSFTVLWGALTGTWFGSARLAALPWLSWMIVPALSSLNPLSGQTFKIAFFTVGAVHIGIAHVWGFLRQAREKPFIRSLAQLGSLSLVLGLYFLVLNLVVSSERFPVPSFARWMIGAGFAAVIVFARQEGRFLRGLAAGLANLLTTTLSSISAFADIISYIRLFAVGLAGVEIARSFNGIAAGLGSSLPGLLAGGAVLLFGHALNMAMGALSVVVHGVRLNMLEFSGHLGMEWSGRPYKPFKE